MALRNAVAPPAPFPLEDDDEGLLNGNTEQESTPHDEALLNNPDTVAVFHMILNRSNVIPTDNDGRVPNGRIPEPGNENNIHGDSLINNPHIGERLHDILDLLNGISSEHNTIHDISRLSEELYQEQLKIIKALRDMADYLAKTHNGVLIADRVGTGVGIGAGVMTIGGLLAAPFTAGLSLTLTIGGIAGGVLGSATSIGANVTGHVILTSSLKKLKEDLEAFNVRLEELANLAEGSVYLTRAARYRPSLERLCQLSESGFIDMLLTMKTIVQQALDGNSGQLFSRIDTGNVIPPEVKEWIRNNLPAMSPDLLIFLEILISQILSQARSAWNAVKAITNYLARPELARLATSLTSLSATARSADALAKDVAEVSNAFKGTPLAMTKTARYAAAGFAAAFVAVDIIHMIRICQETGDTPTVQQLRSLADRMEKDLMGDSDAGEVSIPP